MPEKRHIVSVEEAAELLGVGRNAIYELVRSGTLFSIRVGRRVIIPRKALDRLLGEETPPAAPPAAAEAPKVLWKPCPCCEGTGVIGVKPRGEAR